MLFYYTEKEKIESGEEMELIVKKGYSFNINKVLMTYPTDNGLAVVLISHNLNDVFEVADNIAALYLGNMAAQVNKNEVIPRQVIELITTGKSAGVEAPTANTGAKK